MLWMGCRHVPNVVKQFTRVEGLKKHIRRGCVLRSDTGRPAATGAVSDSVAQVTTDREELLGHSCRAPPTASATQPVEPFSGALLENAAFCALSQQHWKLPLENADMRDALATHCVICGQWCARVKQHHRLMHASAWTMHEQAILAVLQRGTPSSL